MWKARVELRFQLQEDETKLKHFFDLEVLYSGPAKILLNYENILFSVRNVFRNESISFTSNHFCSQISNSPQNICSGSSRKRALSSCVPISRNRFFHASALKLKNGFNSRAGSVFVQFFFLCSQAFSAPQIGAVATSFFCRTLSSITVFAQQKLL